MRLKRIEEISEDIMEVKMKKGLTLAVIFSVLVLFVASSFAQPQRQMMRGKRTFDRSHNRILAVLKANQEELNITDDQIDKIKNLGFSFQEKAIKMKNEGDLLRLELQKLMDRDNLDYDKIKAVLSKSSAFRQEMFIERLKLKDEINNILTPEQREALKAKAKDRFRGEMRPMRDRMQRFPRQRGRIRR